jgi:hypothetical protein
MLNYLICICCSNPCDLKVYLWGAASVVSWVKPKGAAYFIYQSRHESVRKSLDCALRYYFAEYGDVLLQERREIEAPVYAFYRTEALLSANHKSVPNVISLNGGKPPSFEKEWGKDKSLTFKVARTTIKLFLPDSVEFQNE